MKCTTCMRGPEPQMNVICGACQNEGYARHLPMAQDGEPDAPERTADEFLQAAAATMRSRGQTYDKPEGERSMATAVAVFNLKTGHNLTEAEGWLLLQDLKDVRQWSRSSYHHDSALDCVAYAALKAEALARAA